MDEPMTTTDRSDATLISATHRLLMIICAALLVSLVIYVVVATILVNRQGFTMDADIPAFLPQLLAAIGVGMLAVAQAVASVIMRQATAAGDLGARLRTAQTATVIGMALRESTAIIGLVATLLTGEQLWVLALASLSALAMLVNWPRRDRLAEVVTRY